MSDNELHPDKPLRCLLVYPEFSAFSFWNYRDACETIGAKTPSPPLGLITVAAILPQHWEFRLLDLNTRVFSDRDWDWADLICVGGMLPQQKGILQIIAKAKADGKFIVCGGPDPTSQPHIYQHCDALLSGEGEETIPLWLAEWRQGRMRGIFQEKQKPDVTLSPVPRYDLLEFKHYVQIGLQYSRGCPFNCEFCDIIELYGRKPRTKTPEQVTAELSRLHELGYSGSVDIVDDNFIGNKRLVKRELLPAIIAWNKDNGRPFFFSTEASMNMADDVVLLASMRDAGFRIVFMGIETPDAELLLKTQKSQNTVRPIVERVQRLYEYGIVATAGFIMGFDGEKPDMDVAMIQLIEDCDINMAMVGLLVALPNTQLTRRLVKEGRLLSFRGERVTDAKTMLASASSQNAASDVVDQTVAGLNFVTTRDRLEILAEYARVIASIYEPRSYFDRVLRLGKKLKPGIQHRPKWFELRRSAIGFLRLSLAMTRQHQTRRLYWRNVFRLLWRGPFVFEQAMRLMGIYLHFSRQSDYLLGELERQKPMQKKLPASIANLSDVTVA